MIDSSIRHMPAVVVIAGPTGSGKSALAMTMARSEELGPIEIVNADSRQIYKGMDIGTDKTMPADRLRIPHHLIDIIEPDKRYSAADFASDANRCIIEITARGAIPLVVGGTGLYIRFLTCGLARLPGSQEEIRDKYHEILHKSGSATLHQMLRDRDLKRSEMIEPADSFRIIRALEILDTAGIDAAKTLAGHRFGEKPCHSLKIILNVERSKLYKRIDERVDTMLLRGLIPEVEDLRKRFGDQAPGMTGIGYSQICRFLDGSVTLEEAVRLIKRESRHYAKRQITWFRKEPGAIWVDYDPDDPGGVSITLKQWIRRFYDEWLIGQAARKS